MEKPIRTHTQQILLCKAVSREVLFVLTEVFLNKLQLGTIWLLGEFLKGALEKLRKLEFSGWFSCLPCLHKAEWAKISICPGCFFLCLWTCCNWREEGSRGQRHSAEISQLHKKYRSVLKLVLLPRLEGGKDFEVAIGHRNYCRVQLSLGFGFLSRFFEIV